MPADQLQSYALAMIAAIIMAFVMMIVTKRIARKYQGTDPAISLSTWKWLSLLVIIVLVFRYQMIEDKAFGAALVLVSGLLICARIDIEYLVIPNVLTLSIALAGLAASYAGITIPLGATLAGAFTGVLVLTIPALLLRWWTGKTGVGLGDIKLAGAMGIWLGWEPIMEMVFVASILAAIYGIAGLLRVSPNRRDVFPFGPFMAMAGVLILLLRPVWS